MSARRTSRPPASATARSWRSMAACSCCAGWTRRSADVTAPACMCAAVPKQGRVPRRPRRPPKADRERLRRADSGAGFVNGLLARSVRQLAHYLDEVGLALEADARQVRHHDMAVLNPHAVGKSAIGLEQVRIAFIAAKPKPGRDVERHLMPAMRNAAAP